jgi:hypothetical protein
MTDVIDKWIEALESGKYTQCQGELHRKGSFLLPRCFGLSHGGNTREYGLG